MTLRGLLLLMILMGSFAAPTAIEKKKGRKQRRRKETAVDIEVKQEKGGKFSVPKELFVSQLAGNPDIDESMIEELWSQFNAQVESGELKLDPSTKGRKQEIHMRKKNRGQHNVRTSLNSFVADFTAKGGLFHFATSTWMGRICYVLLVVLLISSSRRRCERDGCVRCCCPIVQLCDLCSHTDDGGARAVVPELDRDDTIATAKKEHVS